MITDLIVTAFLAGLDAVLSLLPEFDVSYVTTCTVNVTVAESTVSLVQVKADACCDYNCAVSFQGVSVPGSNGAPPYWVSRVLSPGTYSYTAASTNANYPCVLDYVDVKEPTKVFAPAPSTAPTPTYSPPATEPSPAPSPAPSPTPSPAPSPTSVPAPPVYDPNAPDPNAPVPSPGTRTNPDGTTSPLPGTRINPDGSTTTTETAPDGSTTTKTEYPNGETVTTVRTPAGEVVSTVRTPPLGTGTQGSDPDGKNCISGAFSFNPINWVYVPVKCVLQWAFVPSTETMTSWKLRIDGLKNRPPLSLAVQGSQIFTAERDAIGASSSCVADAPVFLPSDTPVNFDPICAIGEPVQNTSAGQIIYNVFKAGLYIGFGFFVWLRVFRSVGAKEVTGGGDNDN